MIKVIVCGCRNCYDEDMIARTLKKILNEYTNVEIVTGDCRGVDTIAKDFAKYNNYPYKVFKADWDKYGKKAGPIRNEEMIKYAAKSENPILIAFWDGKSKGTKNSIDTAKSLKIHTYIKYV